MSFKISELPVVVTQHPMYSIILDQYDSVKAAEADLSAVNMRCRRYMGKHPGISMLAGVSVTVGDTAIKRRIRTGSRGKPRYEVVGKKDKPHIHMVIFGKGAATFTQMLCSNINRSRKKSIAKHMKCKPEKGGTNIVRYVFNQCYIMRHHGQHDFSPYLTGCYLDYYEERSD